MRRAWILPGATLPLALAGLALLASPPAPEADPSEPAARPPAPAVGRAPAPRRPAPGSAFVFADEGTAPARPPLRPERLRADLARRTHVQAQLEDLDALLAGLGEARAVELLLDLLDRPLAGRTPSAGEQLRLAIVGRLGRYASPRAEGRLLDLVATREGPRAARLAALEALRGRAPSPAASRVLRAIAQRDPDPRVRARARQILG